MRRRNAREKERDACFKETHKIVPILQHGIPIFDTGCTFPKFLEVVFWYGRYAPSLDCGMEEYS